MQNIFTDLGHLDDQHATYYLPLIFTVWWICVGLNADTWHTYSPENMIDFISEPGLVSINFKYDNRWHFIAINWQGNFISQCHKIWEV